MPQFTLADIGNTSFMLGSGVLDLAIAIGIMLIAAFIGFVLIRNRRRR